MYGSRLVFRLLKTCLSQIGCIKQHSVITKFLCSLRDRQKRKIAREKIKNFHILFSRHFLIHRIHSTYYTNNNFVMITFKREKRIVLSGIWFINISLERNFFFKCDFIGSCEKTSYSYIENLLLFEFVCMRMCYFWRICDNSQNFNNNY